MVTSWDPNPGPFSQGLFSNEDQPHILTLMVQWLMDPWLIIFLLQLIVAFDLPD